MSIAAGPSPMVAATASTRSDHAAATADAAPEASSRTARLVQQLGHPSAVVELEIGHHQPGKRIIVTDVVAHVGACEQTGHVLGDPGLACQLAEELSQGFDF